MSERQKRDLIKKALKYLQSDRGDAAKEGIKENEWRTVAREKAITILEVLQDSYEEEDEAPVVEQPKKKLGKYMGVAGEYPEYE